MTKTLAKHFHLFNGNKAPKEVDMRSSTSILLTLTLIAASSLAGCSFMDRAIQSSANRAASRAANKAADKAGESIGNKVGEQVGNAIVRKWTPQLTALYSQTLLSYAFQTGYAGTEDIPYEPGQWTKWELSSPDQSNGETKSSLLERSFLKRDENDNEWWRVRFEDGSAEENQMMILEGLFTKDRTRLLRLRGKFPEQEISELSVQENSSYSSPARYTKESLEGATVGETTIDVPAGTFTARHIRFTHGTSQYTTEWYATDAVPGGIVKYQSTVKGPENAESKEGTTMQSTTSFASYVLVGFGNDATTSELGSF